MTAVSSPPSLTGVGPSRPVSPRRIQRRPGLPGSRAVVGALLLVLAGVGVFVAYQDATQPPATSYVVARIDLRPGDALAADDLDLVAIDLPGGLARRAFSSPAELEGRVLLAPLAAGEVVQASAVTAQRASAAGTELAMLLPRERIAAGRLAAGDQVDVFVTTDSGTASVARGIAVVALEVDSDETLGRADVEVVVSVPDDASVAAIIHALRRGDVTIVRSTFAESNDEAVRYVPEHDDDAGSGRARTGDGG